MQWHLELLICKLTDFQAVENNHFFSFAILSPTNLMLKAENKTSNRVETMFILFSWEGQVNL